MTDLSGTYDVVANSPMGDQKMTLTIVVNGDAFTGTSTGAMGSSDIAGTVAGTDLTWQQAITVPMPLTLDCKATITGDALNGTVDTGGFGSFPLTGRKTA